VSAFLLNGVDSMYKVLVGFNDSGQTTLVKDGFMTEDEAKEFAKSFSYDELDEFLSIKSYD
jgi:hypothetical protein